MAVRSSIVNAQAQGSAQRAIDAIDGRQCDVTSLDGGEERLR